MSLALSTVPSSPREGAGIAPAAERGSAEMTGERECLGMS